MDTKKIRLTHIEPNKGQIEGLPANPRKWEKLTGLKAEKIGENANV